MDNIKDDRLQTGADLIVRAAMGYVRNAAGRWEKRFPPCDAVLFEDLSRYRMRTDRPRRENSQLMRWAHRAVPGEVKMQGELYGLGIAETSAAFSSRYHARTLTPGIRCQPLSASDLDDEWLQEDLARLGIDLATCRPGDLVPRDGGQVFACLRSTGRASADRRGHQRGAEPAETLLDAACRRLPPALRPGQLDGKEVWVPRSHGQAPAGSAGRARRAAPDRSRYGSCRWEPASARRLRGLAVGGDDLEAPADLEAEELSGLAEEAEVAAGKVEVFFRDPSGVVWPADLWFPAKVFWGAVRTKTIGALRGGLAIA